MRHNLAYGQGGGASEASLFNCLVVSNVVVAYEEEFANYGNGGGALGGALNNCTVVANTAGSGGGTQGSALWNCILCDNTNVYGGPELIGESVYFTCASTIPTNGVGNFTNSPLFVNAAAGNFRLAAGSPCINAGTNQDWMVDALDLDGLLRIAGGAVDLGAYEYGSRLPIGFRLTATLLRSPTRLRLEWPSVTGASYQVQSADGLPAGTWVSEGVPLAGTGGVLSTNLPISPGSLKQFFRIQAHY